MNCPNDKKHDVIMIEYAYPHPQRYDGVSEIYCQTEEKRFGRWCLQELQKGESENRFCEGEGHK